MPAAVALLALAVLAAAVSTGHGAAAVAKGKAKDETHDPTTAKPPVSHSKPLTPKSRASKSAGRRQATQRGRSTDRKLSALAPNSSSGGSTTLGSKNVKKGGGSKGGGGNGGGNGGGKKPPTVEDPTVEPTPDPPTTAPTAAPSSASSPPSTTTPAQVTRTATPRTVRRLASARTRGRRTTRSTSRRVTSAPLGQAGTPVLAPNRPGTGGRPGAGVPARAGFAAAGPERATRTARRSGDSETRGREDASSVGRTVRDIVEVVPDAVKVALAGLLALSALLGAGYLLAVTRAGRLARQRADLLQDVGLLQTALLPPVPANVGAMRTSVAYRPSDGPGAGGDFYDALSLPGGRAAFILGDVSGHGRQALARTAFIRYTLRAYIEAGLEPRLALQLAAPVIGEHLGGDFATVALAVHHPQSASLTYACAGHPAPIVVGPTRHEPVVAASSPPIGLGMRTGLRQTTVPLPPGSIVCLYTDGLAEARTDDGILGRPHLADLVEELGRDATAPAVLDRVAEEARLITDDMATVVLSPTAGVTAGGFREERLEIDLDELSDGLGGRFLEACGVEATQQDSALAEARAWAGAHGAAILAVRFGVRGPLVEVLPRNVESLEAASRRRALA